MQSSSRRGWWAPGSGRLLGALAFVPICWACCAVAPALPVGDSVKLPVVTAASIDDGAIRSVLKVTRDGLLIYDGKQLSVNELLGALALDRSHGAVEVRADQDALWMHVQWASAALGESGREEAWCSVAVAGRRAEGVVRVPLTRGVWAEKLFVLPDKEQARQPVHLVVEIFPAPGGEVTSPKNCRKRLFGNKLGGRSAALVPQSAELLGRLANQLGERGD